MKRSYLLFDVSYNYLIARHLVLNWCLDLLSFWHSFEPSPGMKYSLHVKTKIRHKPQTWCSLHCPASSRSSGGKLGWENVWQAGCISGPLSSWCSPWGLEWISGSWRWSLTAWGRSHWAVWRQRSHSPPSAGSCPEGWTSNSSESRLREDADPSTSKFIF